MTGRNYWTSSGPTLREAYVLSDHTLKTYLVTRAIFDHARQEDLRTAVDFGAGNGAQALVLANLGIETTALEPDAHLFALLHSLVRQQPESVSRHITPLQMSAEEFCAQNTFQFDLVCCHSVLLYIEEPPPLIAGFSKCARTGSVLSLLTLNRNAFAMREGLKKNWNAALDIMTAQVQCSPIEAPIFLHNIECLEELCLQHGFEAIDWYGVGIFSDHWGPACASEVRDALQAEWMAGSLDPYRQVARCAHMLFRRV